MSVLGPEVPGPGVLLLEYYKQTKALNSPVPLRILPALGEARATILGGIRADEFQDYRNR